MLRLCICLLAMYLIGCHCPMLEGKRMVKEVAPLAENPVNIGTESVSAVVQEKPMELEGKRRLKESPNNKDTKSVSSQVQQKPTEAANIQWVTTFDEGLKIAKEKNCPLMVDFFAPWCGWCVKLDEETYTNKDVIQLAQRFVCVKIDVDTDRKTPAQYGARSLPTILFISPDGKVIHQVIGYRNSEDMIGEMNAVGDKR